jgi:hypothetical protein
LDPELDPDPDPHQNVTDPQHWLTKKSDTCFTFQGGGLCRDVGGGEGGYGRGSGGGGTGGGGEASGSGGGGDLGGGQPTTRHYRLQRNSARVRQSSSLNRIR